MLDTAELWTPIRLTLALAAGLRLLLPLPQPPSPLLRLLPRPAKR